MDEKRLPFLNLRFRLLVFVHDEFSAFDFDDPTVSHTAVPTCQSVTTNYIINIYITPTNNIFSYRHASPT